jgi:hypothetical protein
MKKQLSSIRDWLTIAEHAHKLGNPRAVRAALAEISSRALRASLDSILPAPRTQSAAPATQLHQEAA